MAQESIYIMSSLATLSIGMITLSKTESRLACSWQVHVGCFPSH